MKIQNTTLLARLLAFLLMAVCNMLPAHAGAIISIDPPSPTVTVGETFSLNVQITGAIDLYAFEFDLGFDPGVLSANNTYEGAFLPSGGATLFINGTIDNLGGTISYTADSLQGAIPGVNGSGILATMSFTALATGSSGINLFNGVWLDSNLSDIQLDGILTSSVKVTQGQTQIPEPATFAMLGFGLVGLEFSRNRRASHR